MTLGALQQNVVREESSLIGRGNGTGDGRWTKAIVLVRYSRG